MDWITKEYVKAEADKGRKEAIECTRLHWQQLAKAGLKELRKAFRNKVAIDTDYCAMCQRYYDNHREMKCPRCFLKCKVVWRMAESAKTDWISNPTQTNWRKWKTAAKAVLAKIDRLYERLYGSKT